MARFKSFDIVAKASGVLRRLAKVKFNRDGSIYVFFPGFVRTDGIVCRARMRGGQTVQTKLDLTENGRVTAHLVKYAHHPDGEAHFSQDRKVKTEVRRKSVPLLEQRGHLFTIQVQNIESFRILPVPRKEQLTLELPENVRALKITAWRHPFSDLKLPEGVVPTGTPKGIQTSDGVTRVGLFVAPPEGEPFDDVVLFLAIEEIPWLSEDKAPQLIFVGGFDHTSIALNHSVETEFLAFAYPCSDFDGLKKRIGCIDLPATDALR
ncbi:MAG: hypothetical protein M0Z99_30535 [Betaproteobacteria bacterium]|nr:hypothetical protein [Betaproteobacteria bacterium]